MAQLGLLGQPRIDQLPVEPAARVVAQHHGQELGGVAVAVVGGRAGGQLQRRTAAWPTPCASAEKPGMRRGAARRRRAVAPAPSGRKPAGRRPPGRRNRSGRPPPARCCPGCSGAGNSRASPRPAAPLTLSARAQHAAAQRVRAEVGRPALLVGPERRLVLVHLGSLRGSPASRCRSPPGGARAGGCRPAGPTARSWILRQHGRVEDRVLLAGEGVVVGAHLVELAVDVVGRAAWACP